MRRFPSSDLLSEERTGHVGRSDTNALRRSLRKFLGEGRPPTAPPVMKTVRLGLIVTDGS